MEITIERLEVITAELEERLEALNKEVCEIDETTLAMSKRLDEMETDLRIPQEVFDRFCEEYNKEVKHFQYKREEERLLKETIDLISQAVRRLEWLD